MIDARRVIIFSIFTMAILAIIAGIMTLAVLERQRFDEKNYQATVSAVFATNNAPNVTLDLLMATETPRYGTATR